MSEHLKVGAVTFRPSRPVDRLDGLLGFATVELGDLRVSSIAVRRLRTGRHALAFPTRRSRRGGQEFSLVQPITAEAHRAIEAQVLAELERRGVLA